ncbi:VWA domain-containing protein [Streptomyces sp. NBC_00237]|uniref:VWA domain-containing protein n=1 Tax=Streptomyces sp. NBC_00237 TaxID=2975687 RepID=UPI002256FE68|nr:VWA domain-containing protein [Streptomyces sp. NBC_00237]MCX5206902.1 VWA domain-containing protein [Streptomyces sp. NBC_00237]
MPGFAPAHLPPAPPSLSAAELEVARWEDDGGPAHLPARTPAAEHWARISAALGDRLPDLAARNDVLVTCEEVTRSGAPAAFFPATAELELHQGLFGPVRPATIHPERPGDEDRYPVAYGALIHEAAHAAHTKWMPPPAVRGTALGQAAELLEESRAERAQLGRRPQDRPYLRATVHQVVMADLHGPLGGGRWEAGVAAGLILARRDAGTLDPEETEPLEQALLPVLGADTLTALATIWAAAHTTSDTDEQAMLAHAAAWCQVLGADPVTPPPTACGTGPDLGEVIGQITAEVAGQETDEAHARARAQAVREAHARARAAQAAQQREAARTAEKVFAPGAAPFTPGTGRQQGGTSPVIGTRAPTPQEKAAAGQLARGLRAAAYRERTATVTMSASPPGRLNMRQALARDAQKAAGATPTATPWVRTTHRPTPTPPLRVGIAVDVSGSMQDAADPMASAAWILAKATALTDPDSRSATIAYDRTLTALTFPGGAPAQVTTFQATGGGHRLAETVDALDAVLELSRPGTGRLLVIASDGWYAPDEAARAAARLTHLHRAGCAVLWLGFDEDTRPLPGATLLNLTHPAQAIPAITRAATAALAATRT